ncbi:MAG: AMP-binding protein [Rhodospirillales bacterium]|nr:AMP-binding protein [Rhodospirillales bacterium]
MNIAALLRKAALQHGPRPALTVHDTVAATFTQFTARAAGIAGGLRERYGLRPGDRVAIAMTNRPEVYEALFGIWWAGLVAVPMNAKLHPREFAYILTNSGARACFASPGLAEDLRSLGNETPAVEAVIETGSADYNALIKGPGAPLADRKPEDPAWLFYTSGTTGRPKGATLSHRNLLVATLSYFADVGDVQPGDTVLHGAPMSHGSGFCGLPFIARGGNNVIPNADHFDPDEMWELVEKHQRVSFFAAPTMVIRLIESPAVKTRDLGNLNLIVYGGAPMYLADLERAMDLIGPRFVQIFGQGESPMTITVVSQAIHADKNYPRRRDILASVGFPRTDVEVRVVGDDGTELPPGEVGEVVVRGDVVMLGYWEDPENTARALRDGWLWTGDMGAMDPDGFLGLKDRSKDMIISGGSNIYPREIEEVLLRHPAVLEASVVGAPHAEWGEEVVAFVVPHPGKAVTENELDALCLDNIARFKRPKRYRVVDALPKNNYGKVLKTELRKEFQNGAA